jgi:hypothetical protein
MSDNGDWSNESNSGTPLPPALAAAAQLVSDNMMETGSDFEIAESIFGKRLLGKAKGKKTKATAALRASVTPTSSMLSSETTPLSYASVSSPARSSGSLAQATPTPAPRPLKAGSKFIQAVSERIEAFPKYGPRPNESEFALFANEVLRFVWYTLKDPAFKDYTLPSSMCGSVSFEVSLAQIIAQCGPPPPDEPTTPTPTTTKAAHPRPSEVETAVMPQKPKRAKALHPAPPPIPAASKKRAPALAVAAPRGKTQSKPAAASVPLAPVAPTPAPSLSKRARRRRRGRHTDHGLSRCGIQLIPPAGSSIRAVNIMPAMLWDINNHLKDDVSSDIILEHSMDIKASIFITASRVPTSSETACVLKHVRRLVIVSGVVPIQAVPVTSTSFLKVIDVPHIPAEPKVWQTTQRTAFQTALRSSPGGASLDKYIKHAPRFMCTSPHADTCVAWIDISDSVSGSNARNFIGKQVAIGGRNCQIRGAAPWPGSAQCTWCMRWGHHSTVCRSKGIQCPLCGGPHSVASHENSCVVEKKDPATRHCLNCSAAKKSKTTHSATDTSCLFWNNRFDRDWLKRQFLRVAK